MPDEHKSAMNPGPRPRSSSNATNGLLSKQLATITDTLAKASQRRDAAAYNKTVMRSTAGPTPALTANLTSDALRGSNSALSDGDAELEQLRWRVEEAAAGFPELVGISMTMRIGFETTDVSLHGDGGFNRDDLKCMFVEGDGEMASRLRPNNTGNGDNDDDDDPKEMLAALERGKQVMSQKTVLDNDDDDDLKSMLAELERASPRVRSTFEDSEGDDLEILRNMIATIHLDSGNQEVHNSISSDTQVPRDPGKSSFVDEETSNVPHLDIMTTSYAIALLLENKGCEWEKAQGITAHLFSTSLNRHDAEHQEKSFVERATEERKIIIQDAMKQEEDSFEIEEKARLLCRLHVSNIAADAGEEDLMSLFSQSRREIRKIEFSKERFPIKGTQSAYIDFWKREAAVEASYILGDIFGLHIKTRLAAEKVDLA